MGMEKKSSPFTVLTLKTTELTGTEVIKMIFSSLLYLYFVVFLIFCLCSILVYSSIDTAVQCLLTFMNPDSCAVLCLRHSHSVLFAGLANGKIALYHRGTEGKHSPPTKNKVKFKILRQLYSSPEGQQNSIDTN